MGSFGGYAHFGGTCVPGGGESAEKRYYDLLQRWLGDKAFDKEDATVRSRFLMCWARGLAAMENEAIKGARESVPCLAIDALDDWESVYATETAATVFETYQRRQAVQQVLMRSQINTANIGRIEDWVALITQTWAYGYENDQTTIISSDGDRYWCVLVPSTVSDDLSLWRLVMTVLEKIAPAHTVPALPTAYGAGAPPPPAFYSDAYRGCALGKDCPGS
jgi:hypothetical protein